MLWERFCGYVGKFFFLNRCSLKYLGVDAVNVCRIYFKNTLEENKGKVVNYLYYQIILLIKLFDYINNQICKYTRGSCAILLSISMCSKSSLNKNNNKGI